MSEDIDIQDPAPHGSAPPAPSERSDVVELLRLLAFTREQAEEARDALARATSRAEAESASADSLRREIEGMTATVTELEARITATEDGRRHIEALAHELEGQLVSALEGAGLAQEATLETRAERDALRAELDDILRSTSWRFTAPVRALTGRLARGEVPGSGSHT